MYCLCAVFTIPLSRAPEKCRGCAAFRPIEKPSRIQLNQHQHQMLLHRNSLSRLCRWKSSAILKSSSIFNKTFRGARNLRVSFSTGMYNSSNTICRFWNPDDNGMCAYYHELFQIQLCHRCYHYKNWLFESPQMPRRLQKFWLFTRGGHLVWNGPQKVVRLYRQRLASMMFSIKSPSSRMSICPLGVCSHGVYTFSFVDNCFHWLLFSLNLRVCSLLLLFVRATQGQLWLHAWRLGPSSWDDTQRIL